MGCKSGPGRNSKFTTEADCFRLFFIINLLASGFFKSLLSKKTREGCWRMTWHRSQKHRCSTTGGGRGQCLPSGAEKESFFPRQECIIHRWSRTHNRLHLLHIHRILCHSESLPDWQDVPSVLFLTKAEEKVTFSTSVQPLQAGLHWLHCTSDFLWLVCLF